MECLELDVWLLGFLKILYKETKYYTNKGGLQSEGKNRQQEALKSVHYLHNKYPTLTKIYLGKKSGMPELKFIKQKINKK